MKNNKGFTLIELLVVVAIIGILAAVGTVAYTGYTSGAKKNSAKSNHAAVVKYIASEAQKCSMDSGATAFKSSTICENTLTGAIVAQAAVDALTDFKNPYRNEEKAVLDTFGNDKEGTVQITSEGNVVTVDTCLTSGCVQAQAEIAADPQANPPIVGQAAVEGVDWATNVIIIE